MPKFILLNVIFALCCSAAEFPAPAVDVGADHALGTAILAGGCFWGVEAVFDHVRGVKQAVSGYAGGARSKARYDLVETGRTGHAESVKVIFDPARISYGKLLEIFFSVAHDPTQLNRQGPDEGTQYRSAIFYLSDEQKQVAEAYIRQLGEARVFKRRIVTQVVPLPDGFFAAEDYHQHFLARNPTNPYIVFNDLPKLAHLKRQFPSLWNGR